ncbi:uncharacterized protein IL334_005021 [Kwoniella shivajii]|uniref:non-specific serine/threonine protein kinase n=1 Tax=Kwoniella shivajii TaxID=564305 RepID=A0ABZ1D4Z6_9TREE|nr:hypothetical protein IL334_005021 [Kwoniella shivajii]
MSGLSGKVTTYGKKKTQIISVHSDILHPVSSSPLPLSRVKRPVLQSKLSNDITNLPPTPLPSRKGASNKEKVTVIDDSLSSPEIIFKARKVNRPGKVVIPRSPSHSPIKKNSRRVPEIIIPLRTTARKPLGSLTKRFSEISIVDSPAPALAPKSKSAQLQRPSIPKRTIPDPQIAIDELSKTCSFPTVHHFSSFLSQGDLPEYGEIRKVGEASYSEVFGLTSSTNSDEIKYVLKVIPLLSLTPSEKIVDKPMPDSSKPEDVKKEIEVTKRMGQVPGGGFVEFIAAYMVQGEYPEALLDKWDLFKGTEGSASVRPSALPATQKYCLLVLSHAGTDLETFKFSQNQGWLQAAGIFWQLASSLARAERWTEFEHRDLHEGQILIQPVSTSSSDQQENYLNPDLTGLKLTIIDFGLSRLSLPLPGKKDESKSVSLWNEIPEEVYEGKGLQWDLYRSMRDKLLIGNSWDGFNPITNVMWLHYIIRYMLTKLRPPKSPNRRSSRATAMYQQEEKAYLMLGQVEKVLGWSVDYDGIGKRRGLRGDVKVVFEKKLISVQEVFTWGQQQGWITEA